MGAGGARWCRRRALPVGRYAARDSLRGGHPAAARPAAGRRPIPIDVAPHTLAARLEAPALLLHSVTDAVADVRHTREYAQVLRDFGKPVEVHYYDAAPHELAFSPPTRDDVLRRAIAFLTRHLAF